MAPNMQSVTLKCSAQNEFSKLFESTARYVVVDGAEQGIFFGAALLEYVPQGPSKCPEP